MGRLKRVRRRIKVGQFCDSNLASKGTVNLFPNFFDKNTGKVQRFGFAENRAAYIDKDNCSIHNFTLRVGSIIREGDVPPSRPNASVIQSAVQIQ